MPTVYALYDSRDPHLYRYVGRTVGPAKRRLTRHRGSTEETHCARWVRKVQREGGRVGIVSLAEVNEDRLAFTEAMFIHALLEAGYPLVNVVIPSRELDGRVTWSEKRRIAEADRWTNELREQVAQSVSKTWNDRRAKYGPSGGVKTGRAPRKRVLREYGPGGARWLCGGCEREMTAGALSNHQRASGHVGREISPVQPGRNLL